MKKNTVLFVEWSTSGREFDMQFPLMYFFKNILNWKVEYKCAYNLPSITASVPDLVILSSTGGESRGLKIVEWCYQSDIPVFSSFTEGMFREKELDEFVWGWNKSKHYVENLRMLWSKPSYEMTIKKYPKLKDKIRVSGAIGFDKYRLLENKKKYTDERFKKVIGYAAFDYNSSLRSPRRDILAEALGQKYLNFLTNELEITKNLLRKLIQKNEDILFLIKSHPGDQGCIPLEVDGIDHLPNVKVITAQYEPIFNIVKEADIWLSGNSTTVIDAWLCNKPTISLISEEREKATPALGASILSQDYAKINQYIKEFFETGQINKFEKWAKKRQQYLSELVGFSDGMNHVRYMSFLKPFIESAESHKNTDKRWNIPLKEKILETLKHLIYSVSAGRHRMPLLSKWAQIYERFEHEELQIFWETYESDVNNFYKANSEAIKNIYNDYSQKNDL